MRTRQLELLRIFINNKSSSMKKILELYDISSRTLYYDLEELNELIYKYGKLKITDKVIQFEGDLTSLSQNIDNKLLQPYFIAKERQDMILFSILQEENKTLENYSEEFKVSRTTIFSDIEAIRSDLKQEDVELLYKNNYYLKGNEWKIRDLYLMLLILKPFSYTLIREDIRLFNIEHNLLLSDYSMFYLSIFIEFIKKRIKNGCHIDQDLFHTLNNISEDLNWQVNELLETLNIHEINYLKGYIISLSGMIKSDKKLMITKYVDTLLKQVEQKFALTIRWDNNFKRNLQNHLLSSYYRIEYFFPALNPSLNDIRMNYFELFHGLKQIIRNNELITSFSKMRDEEVGFVAVYIGGYLLNNGDIQQRRKKIVIVCPQGRAVSNNLKYQILNFLPDVDIIANHSIDQIGQIYTDYDYIISTVELPHLFNVIKVNPILSQVDKQNLSDKISSNSNPDLKNVEELYSIILDNAEVINSEKLKSEIKNFLIKNRTGWRYQPMLRELLSRKRIKKVKSAKDWKDAISIASRSLVEDGSIEESYVDAMIASIEKFGPYIVLADEFALPHASNEGHVNELSMSMLILDENVDLLGKDVKVFLVLASIDNKSHLKALASLTDILSDEKKLEFIKTASVDEIVKLIEQEEVTE